MIQTRLIPWRDPETGRHLAQTIRMTPSGLELVGDLVITEPEDAPAEAPAEPGLARMAWTLAAALTSKALHGPTPDIEQRRRRLACTGHVEIRVRGETIDTELAHPCPSFRREDDGDELDGYCEACGCPEWRLSRMRSKWSMPAAPCPRGRY